jgi:hypothetical protein
MRRGLTIFIAAVVVIFCAVVILVYTSIGSVITAAISEGGTEILGTHVNLQESDFSPTSGEGELIHLTVSNPEKFGEGNAFYFPLIDLQIDPETISSGVMVIKRIRIEAPEILYDITPNGDNLRAVRENIAEAVARAHQTSLYSNAQGQPPVKFVLNDLYITNGVVVVKSGDLSGKKATALLGDIHLENIGLDTNGLFAPELVSEIYAPVLRATSIAALSTDLKLSDQARNILQGAIDETEGVVNKIKQFIK